MIFIIAGGLTNFLYNQPFKEKKKSNEKKKVFLEQGKLTRGNTR